MLSKRFLAFTCILVYGLLSSLLVLFSLYHPLLKGILKDTLNKKEPNLATYLQERRTGLGRDEMVNNSQRTVSCGMGTDLKNQSSIWNLEEVNPLKFLSNFKNPCYLINVTRSRHTTQRLRCLPYYFIVGFPKSGTTDVWNRLKDHPDILGKRHKEPNFYRKEMLVADFHKAVETYASHFERAAVNLQKVVSPAPGTRQKHETNSYHPGIIGEGSVDTAFDNPRWKDFPGNENCVEPRITNADYFHKLLPNLKVIFLVRNPVERLYSDYIFEARSLGYVTKSSDFHSTVLDVIHQHQQCQKHYPIRACVYKRKIDQYKVRLRVGMYHIFIKDWLKIFPKEQIIVIKTEDMENAKNNSKVYKQLLQFLEIRQFTSKEEATVLNKRKSNTRNAQEKHVGDMWNKTKIIIENFYRSHNRHLADLLGDDRFLWNY